MRKGKKLTFLVTVLCTLALLMSLFSITPFAASATADDTTNKVTATTTTTVKQGDVVNCYVYIDSLESLSSLNVAVHFDPDKVSVTSSFNNAPCALYDSSINESYVQFSYIFDGNGEAKKTQLFYFQYKVLTNAEEGAAHFDVVVSEAYDSSLNVANISGSRCPFTIAKKVTSKTCSVSGISTVSTAIKEEFELSYRLNTTGVASGSFVIRYDAELFEFIECSVGGLLENKFYDIKTDQPGIIYVSFVGTEYADSSQLLTVKFKTIRNATQSSQIKLSVTDFYDLELNSIGCNGYTTNVNLTYDPTYSDDAPTMTVSTVYSAEKQQVTVTIKLEAGSYLGAGDFILNFNTEYFTYNSATKGFVPTFFNINDKKASEGIVKFSIISMSDIMTEETVLTVILDTPVFCNDVIADFDIGGSGLSDSMTNPILINFVDSSLSISGVGHDLISHPAQAPTCTEIGWYAYATCSRCDYTTYEEIPANGHSYVHTICTVCDDKQPVFRSWDVSVAGDGSVMANLYENVVDGGYELEIAGTGAMMDWNSTSDVPWYNAYRTQTNYLMIEDGITSIGARAFYGCTALTGAIIPNNVETIGSSAFYGCNNLSSVTFGTSVKTVGNYAFYGCNSLASAVLPNSVETIGEYAFYNCTSMSELSLGTSVATIGTYAFGNCSALTSVTIPESVTTIGTSAFVNCYLLNEINFNASAMNDLTYNNNVFFNAGINGEGIAVTIGANVTKVPAYLFYSTSNGASYLPKVTSVTFASGSICESIGSYAFYNVDEITSIVLPNTVKSIGNYAFAYCYALTSADLGNSVETIGSNAFYYCTALESVDLGDAVVSIGSSAFYNCYTLESITIPESVTAIGSSAFYNCKALTEIIFNAAEMADLSNNNYVFYNAGIDGDGVAVRIGASVTKIPAYLFYATSNNTSYNPKITSVTFEDNSACKTIGTYAFAHGKYFEQIVIPEGVESIGDYAFYYCSNLLRVQIPSSVTSIGYYAFINCPNIVFAFGGEALPATLSSSWRNSDTIYHLNAERFVVVNEAMYIIFNDETAAVAKYYGSDSEYTILDKVDNIPVVLVGKNAFRSNTALQKIVIPNTVTKIDEYAFYNCTALAEVEMGASVKTIGTYAFAYCSALTEISISDSVESINSNAFYSCTALESVYIGESVKTFGTSAFSNCTALTEIQFNATSMNDLVSGNSVFYNAGINGDGIAVTIGSGVTKIPAYLFYSTTNSTSYLPKITTVTFESGSICESIGSYAFYYADELTSINLPASIETISTYAFANCYVLSSITIPESVTTVGNYAFYNCKALTEIIFNATEMADLSSNNYVFYYAGLDGDGIAVSIGANVTKIPAYLFYASTNNSSYLPKIISVEFASGSACESIGSYAFYYSDDLASINLPATIETIGTYAFAYCSSLTSITVPANVTNVGTYVFYGCTALTEIEFNAIAMNDLASNNCVFYNAGVNGEGITVTIGATVTKVPAYLFYPYNSSSYCPKITSVTFENGSACESIGNCAFYYSDELVSINLPATIKTIGTYAFAYCSSLTGITIPASVTNVGTYAFCGCTALTQIEFNAIAMDDFASSNYVFYNAGANGEGIDVTIGAGVTKIPAYLFYPYDSSYCPNIISVTFASGSVCESIGNYAFYYADGITSIELPNTVKSIGNYAFAYCYALTSADLGNSLETVGSNAFYYCTSLESVNLGKSIVTIGYAAFYNCTALESVNMSEVVTTIDSWAFYNCTALTSITIPETVTSIGDYAFQNCTSLVEIIFNAVSMNDLANNNYVFYNAGVNTDGINVWVGDKVTKIPAYLFYATSNNSSYLPKIANVIFDSNSVCTEIGAYAFNGIRYLNQVVLPDGVTTIGTYAFYNCSNLLRVRIPDSVNTIDAYAFNYCSNAIFAFESDELPSALGSSWKSSEALYYLNVEKFAVINDALYLVFHDETAAIAKYYGSDAEYTILNDVDGIPVVLIGEKAFRYNTTLTNVIIPNAVTKIATYAFSGCSALTSVTIPESVVTIENYAFYNCTSISEIEFNAASMNDLAYNNNVFYNAGVNGSGIVVTIGKEVTRVPAYLFYATSNSTSYLPKITLVEFEEGSVCESIGSYAFYCSSKLLRVMIPDTVSEIGTYAFYGCSKAVIGFEADTLPTTGSSWYSSEATYYLNAKQFVAINEALYVILNDNTATFAKYYGEATEYQVLDAVEGVTVTAIGANAFRNNTKIEYVTIPETVVHINASAFYGCSALKNFTMPSNLLTIGSNAFYGCSALTSVLLPETVNNIGAGAFNSCNKLTIGFASATQSATLGSSWSGDSGYYYNIKEFVVYDDATYAITNDNTAILGRYYGTATEYAILESVNGATVTIVGKSAFRNVTALIDVSIPDSVTRIEGSAFYNCTSLESITIPQYVTYIGNYAFYNTRALTEINFNAIDVTDLSSSNYVFYCAGQNGEGIKVTIGAQVTKIPNYLFYPYSTTSYLPKITEFTFEEGSVCKIIGSYTFAYNTNLTNIVLPEGVEVIRSYAFANTNITNIIIPNSVYNIQSNAFRNCTSLVSVHMPSALTTIGSEAFYGCTALTEIVIPEGVTSIGSSAFCNCKSLTQITFNAVAANDLGTNNYVFYNAGIDGEGITVLIGKDVTRIPSYIFYPYYSSTTYNPKVTRVIFEDDSACTTIGSYAFYSCSGITEIVIPEKITSINSSAFQNVGLKLVYICSDRIASNVSSASSYGYLLDGVSTVVIRSGIGRVNAYISDNFVNTEAITYQGVDYISYSVHVHSWTEHEVLIPFIACEQDGCIRYICSDCGAFKDVTTFRHDVIVNDAKEPTCLNVGWYEYHTCSRCDYTTYVEIPALGHRVLVDGRIWVDSITFENDANYPFTLQDGIYSSTNHSDNTDAYFTITALYDCTLNISYAISSEQNYDKIIVRVNGSTVVEISGQVDWTSKTIELNAGDIVTVNYHKDTSASVGEDTGWFSFTCEQTEIGSLVPGSAEEAEPTCTEAVVCHYCQTVVKEALGHDEIHHSAQAQTCTEIGWHAYDTCSRCDYTTYVEIPANGHSYGEWSVILDPTCTEIGTERRDCNVCDHYETRDVVALGHDEINHSAQAPTCTEIGWNTYVTCSRCDYTTYVEIAALGHDEIAHPAKAPTCTEIGWYAYDTCSRCDYTTYVERAVLGHDTINHEAQAPTCTEIGWYAYDTCSRCTYTTYVEIAATGHNYVRTNCSVCGEAQPAINTWDISSDSSNSLIAKIYRNYVEGGYELVISGNGAMSDYEYNEPWSSYRGSITRVELPDGITSIGNFAFYSCTSLRQITIPESVELIGKYAFAYSGNLVIAFESNKLPSVNGSYWDQSCSYYLSPQKIIVTDDATYVIDSDGNASLAKYVGNATEFVAWETVEGITLTGIGQYAFYNKDTLQTFWITDNISYIGREAFYGCKGLAIMMESSEFPSYIGSSWNGGCSYYLGAETWIENDFLFVRDKDNKVDLIRYQGTSEEVTVPAQAGVYPIQSIRQYAFYRSTVKTIIVSEGIQIIGNEAFSGCSYLQSIQLPQSLLKIGSYAFRDCSSLQEIQLPQNLTSIGNDAFWGCSKIKSMVIPQGVTVLDGTFVNCYELESVTLHDGITQLGGMTFYGCHSLKEIQLPKKLSSLGYYTFYNCYALNTIEFLENIHSINWSTAFVGTKIDVMYIRSSRLAASITESAWSAEIFQTLKTIVVPAGSGTTYLQSIFTHCETIYRDGVAYDVYSLNAHSWQQEVIEEFAICQNDGVILYTCENCGVEKLEITLCHDKVYHEAKAPNCTEIGWTAYETCSRCDYTTYVEISANGHSYGDWVVILDPTCTVVGTERRDCNDCEHYETRDVAVLGHDLLHHSAKEVTCTNIGWNAFDTCSRCDYTTYVEIPATGHTYDNWIETKAPTCLTKGSERRDCHCGHFETRDVAALGHDIVHHNAQPATCTVIGWDAYDTCSRCDYTTYAEIPAIGHTASYWIIDTEATYEADGSKHKECTVCHTVLETSTIPMLTHSYVAVVTPPTCTERGYTTHTCSDCGKSYVDDYIPATGHDYGAWVQILAPKCEAVGTDRRDCTICDHYETRDVSATGHTESEWIVDLNATCTVNGSKHIECTVCEKTLETEVLTKLGHDEIVHTAKAPTCTEIGWSMYVTCSRCDYSTYAEIPANGHAYGEWIAEIPAECESEGTLGHYHCGACNTNFDINHNILATLVIPETGHTKSDWIVDVESICTADGSRHEECTVCGKVLETAVIPMLGHDTVQHSAKAPTCTEIGWDTYEVCTRCSYTTYIEKPANGHAYGSFIAEIPATCEKEGTLGHYHCSACGCNFDIDKNILLELVIAATGHTESGWIVDANATCTLDGSKHIACTVCEKTLKTETIVKLGHSELIHNSKAPTCTEIGWNAYVTCSRCDYSTYVEIPANGHSYGAWEVILDPTCLTKGTERRDCNNCDHYETRDVAALGHDEVSHDAKAPTCTEIGWDAYVTCSRCDYSTYAEKKALGHDEATHEAKAPTCTEIGWKAYVTCSRCDYSTYVEIPATGHSMDEWVETKAPTCTATGTEQRNCKNCDYFETHDLAALGHDEANHDAKAPTCTEIGWNAYVTCSRCDYTTYVEIPATGHTASDWIIDAEATYEADGSKHKECTVCGETLETSIIPMLTHSYESIVTPPTCTERGYTTHTCSDCGDVYIDDYVDATGHTYGEWLTTTAPTCTTGGQERRDCENCDHFETRDVAALGHDTVSHPAQSATCTDIGWNTYDTCSRCDYTTYVEIPATGHTYGNWVETKAPTCLTKGTERRDCHCGHFETRDVAALGHDIVHHNAQAVTCTVIGWDAYDTCSRCDYTTYVEIPATGHTASDWIIDAEATYEADGSKHKECTVCGETLETSIIPMLTHSYESIVTPPTCTERGYTTHTCSDCGDVYIDDYVDATGHTYGEWLVTTAPTCTTGGQERRDCENCDHFETRDVAALGHDTVSHPAQSATCTDIGWNAYDTCLRCDYTTYVEIPANGHSYGDWVETIAPTCTENGEKAKECSVCHNIVTEVVNKLGHDEVNHNAQTATCEQIGWSAYVTCSRCDYTTYVEIPKLDHSMGEWTTTAPTCLEKGEEHRACSNCEYSETRELAALNHDRIEHEAQAPSCTEVGWDAYVSCSRCDYTTYVELPSKGGHTYGEWERIIDPTPDTAGMDRRTCSVCGGYENRDVAALGYLQAFINAVENLSENESAENTYSELYSALQLYSKLTDDEKQEANEEFLVLQVAVNAYNSKAETANTELKNATEIAFVPISASFTFLAALWFLLKKKFWIK